MSFFQPKTIADLADDIASRNRMKGIHADFRSKEKQNFLKAVHEYRLQVGDKPVGPPMTMTGFDAAARNQSLEVKFSSALDAGKKVRLSRWVVVSRD